MAGMKFDEQLSDEAFDAFLREETPYINDAGFTVRVVRQMPARRAHRSLRSIILIGVALLASAVAYTLSDRGEYLREVIHRFAMMSPIVILLSAIAAGILVLAFGAISAISKVGTHNLR
jgi:hypothetical protein